MALRNINLIIQNRPDILKHERLTSQSNIVQLLSELKEYASEVDVDFIGKSVRARG